jgi:hypothetical protein
VGRQVSEAERARLYRLRDALGLRDNDAFWSIVRRLSTTTRSSGRTLTTSPSDDDDDDTEDDDDEEGDAA